VPATTAEFAKNPAFRASCTLPIPCITLRRVGELNRVRQLLDPGSLRPPRNSSEAPPPVEMMRNLLRHQLVSPLRPNLAPPTSKFRQTARGRHALRDFQLGPSRKPASRTRHRPVPRGPCFADSAADRKCFRADVHPSDPRGLVDITRDRSGISLEFRRQLRDRRSRNLKLRDVGRPQEFSWLNQPCHSQPATADSSPAAFKRV